MFACRGNNFLHFSEAFKRHRLYNTVYYSIRIADTLQKWPDELILKKKAEDEILMGIKCTEMNGGQTVTLQSRDSVDSYQLLTGVALR